jgi:hypothetical protein
VCPPSLKIRNKKEEMGTQNFHFFTSHFWAIISHFLFPTYHFTGIHSNRKENILAG